MTTKLIEKHISIKLYHTCTRPLFCLRDLDINPMTLNLEGDLDILKMYLHTENEVARLRHSELNR